MDRPVGEPTEPVVVRASIERRVVEVGFAVFWALMCLGELFPPSGEALAPWMLGPLLGLVSLHFLQRAFDRQPRLIVDSEGVTDRGGPFGTSLFIAWSEIVDVSLSPGSPVGLVVRDVAEVQRRAGVIRRIWMKLDRAVGLRTVPIRLPVLSGGKPELKKQLEAGLLQFERRELGLSASPRLAKPDKA
jgi:hypothetical protein